MEIPHQDLPSLPASWLSQAQLVVQKSPPGDSHLGSTFQKSIPLVELLAQNEKTLVVLVRHPG